MQYDGLELLVEAVSVYVQTGGRFDATTWRLVRELADSVAAEETGQPQPSNGIWEQRDSALLIGGDLGRWLVLDGVALASRAISEPPAARLTRRRPSGGQECAATAARPAAAAGGWAAGRVCPPRLPLQRSSGWDDYTGCSPSRWTQADTH